MAERILSVFIDESGDFGPYDSRAPYYIVTMVLHDQSVNIADNIVAFNEHLSYLGYPQHAVHTGPLIRRESIYSQDLVEDRKRVFNALFHFARRLDIRYVSTIVRKSEQFDVIKLTARLSRELASTLREHEEYLNGFDIVNIYYDNGQIELTKVLTSVFSALYAHVDFRRVKPVDYKLFQVADLICTIELLAEKAENNSFSRSEMEFFGSVRDFKRNYLKYIRKKLL